MVSVLWAHRWPSFCPECGSQGGGLGLSALLGWGWLGAPSHPALASIDLAWAPGLASSSSATRGL